MKFFKDLYEKVKDDKRILHVGAKQAIDACEASLNAYESATDHDAIDDLEV